MHLITRVAEYGIIFNEKGEFLMVRFAKDVNPSEAWIFPGGRLDEGDKPEDALVREIKEETNLDVEVGPPCGVSMWGKEEDHRYAVFFICTLLRGEVKLCKEHQEYRWFSKDDVGSIDFHDKSFKRIIENALR